MKQLLPVYLLIMIVFTGAPFNRLRASSVQDKPPREFTLRFRHVAGDRQLQLLTDTCRNNWGEPFTVRQFRYYIHRLTYIDDKGIRYAAPEAYYLVDEADSSSKIIHLPAPAGIIKSVHFIIGVDSSDNSSGAQAGALDPVKGMFWTWNSGYIFAKLEGRSESSHAPGHYFSYHVGGFKQPRNAQREVTLTVAATVGDMPLLIIQADVLAWFHAVHPVSIGQSPVCHEPGAMALELADNYAHMFSITTP